MKTKKTKKTSPTKRKRGLYIIHVAGGVEPELYGPYANNNERNASVPLIEDDRECDAMFKLNISPSGKPSVETWSGGEMETILGLDDDPSEETDPDAEEDDPDRKASRAAHKACLANLSDESYEDLRRHDALGLNDN